MKGKTYLIAHCALGNADRDVATRPSCIEGDDPPTVVMKGCNVAQTHLIAASPMRASEAFTELFPNRVATFIAEKGVA